VLGAAEIPVDPPAGWRPDGLLSKSEAGADFIQTQFCMDAGVARRYAARLLDLGIAQRLPLLIGVPPIPSVPSARGMKETLSRSPAASSTFAAAARASRFSICTAQAARPR